MPKRSAVPHPHELTWSNLTEQSSTTLEEIEDVHEFIQKLEKIELPNQLVAVIGDPLLQKFLQLRSSEIDTSRIDSWLLAFFEDQLQNSSSGQEGILEMLDAILKYARCTKVRIHLCSLCPFC